LVGFELEITSFQVSTWPLLFRSRVERRDFAYDRAMVSSDATPIRHVCLLLMFIGIGTGNGK
jgi:hypothetical protein